jgi:hypothetical protein
MRRNYKMTVRRICAAVGLVMVTAWGIPALAPAPAALASPAVASATTHSTPPHAHLPGAARPLDAGDCTTKVEKAGYTVGALVTAGCQAGAFSIPGAAPHVSISIQLAACGGFLTAAKIDPITMTFACLFAVGPSLLSIQFCGPNFGSDCLNAWGGGPWVDVYTGGDETGDTHQHFMVIDENGDENGTAEIMFTGSGSWNGECIGDAYNNTGYADTSLDACARPGQSAGWGTQMTWGTSGCPSGTVWFHDNHWNGYLAPGAGDGSHWYLNDQTKTCLAIWTDLAV